MTSQTSKPKCDVCRWPADGKSRVFSSHIDQAAWQRSWSAVRVAEAYVEDGCVDDETAEQFRAIKAHMDELVANDLMRMGLESG